MPIEYLTLKKGFGVAVAAFAVVGSFFAVISYFESNYVSQGEFLTALAAERDLRNEQRESLEDDFVRLSKELIKGQNRLAKDIKDAKGFTLGVQRDILLAKPQLTPAEQAELRVLEAKLRELNLDSPST